MPLLTMEYLCIIEDLCLALKLLTYIFLPLYKQCIILWLRISRIAQTCLTDITTVLVVFFLVQWPILIQYCAYCNWDETKQTTFGCGEYHIWYNIVLTDGSRYPMFENICSSVMYILLYVSKYRIIKDRQWTNTGVSDFVLLLSHA